MPINKEKFVKLQLKVVRIELWLELVMSRFRHPVWSACGRPEGGLKCGPDTTHDVDNQ